MKLFVVLACIMFSHVVNAQGYQQYQTYFYDQYGNKQYTGTRLDFSSPIAATKTSSSGKGGIKLPKLFSGIKERRERKFQEQYNAIVASSALHDADMKAQAVVKKKIIDMITTDCYNINHFLDTGKNLIATLELYKKLDLLKLIEDDSIQYNLEGLDSTDQRRLEVSYTNSHPWKAEYECQIDYLFRQYMIALYLNDTTFANSTYAKCKSLAELASHANADYQHIDFESTIKYLKKWWEYKIVDLQLTDWDNYKSDSFFLALYKKCVPEWIGPYRNFNQIESEFPTMLDYGVFETAHEYDANFFYRNKQNKSAFLAHPGFFDPAMKKSSYRYIYVFAPNHRETGLYQLFTNWKETGFSNPLMYLNKYDEHNVFKSTKIIKVGDSLSNCSYTKYAYDYTTNTIKVICSYSSYLNKPDYELELDTNGVIKKISRFNPKKQAVEPFTRLKDQVTNTEYYFTEIKKYNEYNGNGVVVGTLSSGTYTAKGVFLVNLNTNSYKQLYYEAKQSCITTNGIYVVSGFRSFDKKQVAIEKYDVNGVKLWSKYFPLSITIDLNDFDTINVTTDETKVQLINDYSIISSPLN